MVVHKYYQTYLIRRRYYRTNSTSRPITKVREGRLCFLDPRLLDHPIRISDIVLGPITESS